MSFLLFLSRLPLLRFLEFEFQRFYIYGIMVYAASVS